MEQTLDFSFHKGNPLAEDEDIESPKPMPSPPPLPLISGVSDDDCDDSNEQNISDTMSIQAAAVEVIETISISPAPKSGDNGTHDSYSSSEDLVSTTNPPVPKFSNDGSQGSMAKPKPRAKVPLERGFTQVDWLRLTKIEPDLAGLKGGTNRRLIPMSEIKLHRSEDDAWTVLKGRVYNITRYLKFHPGGSDMLMKGSGKDCTALFNKYHSWVNAEYLLEKCLVGFLDVEH